MKIPYTFSDRYIKYESYARHNIKVAIVMSVRDLYCLNNECCKQLIFDMYAHTIHNRIVSVKLRPHRMLASITRGEQR